MRAIVLLSGGLDSYTAAAIAKSEGFTLDALSILYGQRHAQELAAARKVAAALGVRVEREGLPAEEIVRIASIGRDFFIEMKPRVIDSEVRAAFEYISDVKSRFVLDMTQWAPADMTSTARARMAA